MKRVIPKGIIGVFLGLFVNGCSQINQASALAFWLLAREGVIIGAIPIFTGAFKGRLGIGGCGFLACVLTNTLVGPWLSIPAAALFVWLIVDDRKANQTEESALDVLYAMARKVRVISALILVGIGIWLSYPLLEELYESKDWEFFFIVNFLWSPWDGLPQKFGLVFILLGCFQGLNFLWSIFKADVQRESEKAKLSEPPEPAPQSGSSHSEKAGLSDYREMGAQSSSSDDSKKERVTQSPESGPEVSCDKPSEKVLLWNPSEIGALTLLFSPIFGAILTLKNWETLGEKARASKGLYWAYAYGAMLLYHLLRPIHILWYGAFFIVWYFCELRPQIMIVKNKFRDSYSRKPFRKAIGIGIAAIVGYLVLGLLCLWVTDRHLFTVDDHRPLEDMNGISGETANVTCPNPACGIDLEIKGPTSEQIFVCPDCKEEFIADGKKITPVSKAEPTEILVTCPYEDCGAKLTVDDDTSGKVFNCPECGKDFHLE